MPEDEHGRYLVEYYVSSGRGSDCIHYGERVYLKSDDHHLSNRELTRLYFRKARRRIDDHGLAKHKA